MIHVGVAWGMNRRYGEGIIRGIAEYGRRFGPWRFSLHPVRTFDRGRLKSAYGLDGIIVGYDESSRIDEVRWPAQVPLVAVHHVPKEVTPFYVQLDNRAVGRMAAEEFLRRGFRNLAYFPAFPQALKLHWEMDRQEGFRDAARVGGAQVAVYPGAIEDWEDLEYEPARDPLSLWLSEQPKPLGVFGADDSRARCVILLAEAAGIRVPEEVAVIGVGNETWTEILSGGLSSVEPDGFSIGYAAAELIHQCMEKRAGAAKVIYVPPLRLIVRRSSSGVAIEDEDVALAVRFIAERATTGIGVREVAEAAPMSRRSLERRFFRAVGRTILQEIRFAQVERAKLLLADPNIPLRRIAKVAGFPTVKAMGTIFLRVTGIIPSAYRAQQKSARKA